MYCEKCGNLIHEGFQFCMNCGTKIVYEKIEEPKPVEVETPIEGNSIDETIEKVEVVIAETKETETPVVYSGMHCSSCGFEYFEGEKYCISCGSNLFEDEAPVVAEKVEDEEIPIQKALFDFFNSNKVLAFILKYGFILALPYPLYLIIGKFDAFVNIYDLVTNVSIILYYVYYISLVALYAKKNYIGLFVALGVRFVNASIAAIQSTMPLEALMRMAIIIATVVYVYKELMTESQRKNLIDKIKRIGK